VKNAQLDLTIGELCGIEEFSSKTIAVFHIFNKDNYLAPNSSYEANAKFKKFVMPPSGEELCRFGDIFAGGQTAIINYEAGVGTNASWTNVAPFRKVSSLCIFKNVHVA
jgi:hypothetical protein